MLTLYMSSIFLVFPTLGMLNLPHVDVAEWLGGLPIKRGLHFQLRRSYYQTPVRRYISLC